MSHRCPNKDETELAKIFLEGKTVSEALEFIGKKRPVNHLSRKAFTEAFNVMQELKSLDQEPNWTEAMTLSNKYSMSLHRVLLLARAMFHAGWKPSKMTQIIIEKLRKPETNHSIQ
jgi:cell division protein ZapA (FtsZ GTPase activity inhibitor)